MKFSALNVDFNGVRFEQQSLEAPSWKVACEGQMINTAECNLEILHCGFSVAHNVDYEVLPSLKRGFHPTQRHERKLRN